jgi:DNA processing protein
MMLGKKIEAGKYEFVEKIRPRVKELWYRGNLDLMDSGPKLAIVGSRRMSTYGAWVLEKWMPELVANEVVIVSGFMYGVDQKAHRECLVNGGGTIGVLGWGIDRRAAEMDQRLEAQMEEKGLLLSEYPGPIEAALYMFPARNRIVAGISDAVLLIEAAQNSGSLITADWATRMGKPLLALPGNVTSRISKGTNWLIGQNKAQMVTEVGEVLAVLGLAGKKDKQLFLSDPILELLRVEPKMIDEIVKITRRPVGEVMGKLSEWELMGVIECRGGRYYINSK